MDAQTDRCCCMQAAEYDSDAHKSATTSSDEDASTLAGASSYSLPLKSYMQLFAFH